MTIPESGKTRAINFESSSRRFWKSLVAVTICACLAAFMITCSSSKEIAEVEPVADVEAPTAKVLVEIDPTLDFSKYKHLNPQHERLPCAVCHTRQDREKTLTFAGHIPCASCHIEQFADNKNAICSICHSNAENGEMKRFPGLQNFTASFDHGKHLREARCADCHRPNRNGVSVSIPARSNSHSTCFQCHKPETEIRGKEISSCGTCHQSGRPPRQITETARAFGLGFTHADHKMNCADCHKVKAGSSRGNQVNSPAAAMHSASKNIFSCATCHNNKRAFGGDDFSDCSRCHKGPDFTF